MLSKSAKTSRDTLGYKEFVKLFQCVLSCKVKTKKMMDKDKDLLYFYVVTNCKDSEHL